MQKTFRSGDGPPRRRSGTVGASSSQCVDRLSSRTAPYPTGLYENFRPAEHIIYIYMLEIVAQVVPLLAMQDTIDKFVIMFVDNEPARHALAKGFGKDDSINCLLQHAWRRIEDLSLRPAWQRVTSSANVSDAVSRGDLRHARAEGWTEVQLDWDALFEELLKGSEASGVL